MLLDENSVVPLYYQLKELIKGKVKDGSWGENQKVASERELMELYGISRATVRKALDELMVEGLIYKKQGIGTFVSKAKISHDLIGELSFKQQAKNQGFTPSSKVVYAAIDDNIPKRNADVLKQENTNDILKIIRVRYVNGEPLILETLYILEKFSPDLLEQNLEEIAIFKYLKEKCNINFTYSTLDIEPIMLSDFELNYLQVHESTPALSLERIIYSEHGATVIQERVMRGDRGKFSL